MIVLTIVGSSSVEVSPISLDLALARRDLAQDAAHDLARAGLRQLRHEVDVVRLRDRPDLLADVTAEDLRRGRRSASWPGFRMT